MSRSTLRTAEVVPGSVFLVLGAVVAWMASQDYTLIREGGRVGPGLLPFITGVALAVIGLLLVVAAFGRPSAVPVGEHVLQADEGGAAPAASPSAEQVGPTEPAEAVLPGAPAVLGRLPVAPLLLLMLAGTLVLMPVLGHFTTFGLFIVVVVTVIEKRSLLTGVVAGVAVAVGGWAIFTWFLSIQTAEGLLP